MSASKFRSGMVLMAAALAAVTISGCSGTKRPRLAYEERPVEALYNTGYDRLQQRRWSDAVDYFQEVERQHPYSDWARRSILMQIYAYYQNNNYADAIAAADRFIQLFPGNPSAAYAFYMKAVCNFEQITDVVRSLAIAALGALGVGGDEARVNTEALTREPNSEFCLNMSKLMLFQCLAASRPSYEDIFCLGRHVTRDLATCATEATQITTIVVGDPQETGAPVRTPVAATAPAPAAAPAVTTTQSLNAGPTTSR